jgi:hypothetical protein
LDFAFSGGVRFIATNKTINRARTSLHVRRNAFSSLKMFGWYGLKHSSIWECWCIQFVVLIRPFSQDCKNVFNLQSPPSRSYCAIQSLLSTQRCMSVSFSRFYFRTLPFLLLSCLCVAPLACCHAHSLDCNDQIPLETTSSTQWHCMSDAHSHAVLYFCWSHYVENSMITFMNLVLTSHWMYVSHSRSFFSSSRVSHSKVLWSTKLEYVLWLEYHLL